jgi:hypothetical protein
VISDLSCGFADRGSGGPLGRRAPMLTVAGPCIWHGCGTKLSRRQPATMVCAKLKDLMVGLVQSSERAQLIYQHECHGPHQGRCPTSWTAAASWRRPVHGPCRRRLLTLAGWLRPLRRPADRRGQSDEAIRSQKCGASTPCAPTVKM